MAFGLQEAAGWSGASIAFCANLYYIFLIRRGEATPHPVTWVVWALIGALGAIAAVEAGAGSGALVPIAYTLVYFLTSYYALRQYRSRRGHDQAMVTRYDLAVGGIAAVLAVIWKLADLGPGWLALLAVTADMFAVWPTMRYAWTQPTTSPERGVWFADTLAAGLGLYAVSLPWTAAAVAYPGYLAVANGAVFALMWIRRAAHRPTPDPRGSQARSSRGDEPVAPG